jgi:hypothetical protein
MILPLATGRLYALDNGNLGVSGRFRHKRLRLGTASLPSHSGRLYPRHSISFTRHISIDHTLVKAIDPSLALFHIHTMIATLATVALLLPLVSAQNRICYDRFSESS